MTDTIEAVALWEAVREWQWPDGTTPREWFMQHVSAYTQAAIASHTKALIEQAGEIERYEIAHIYGEEWRNPNGQWVRYDQAAATIAALRAENERAREEGVRAGIEAAASAALQFTADAQQILRTVKPKGAAWVAVKGNVAGGNAIMEAIRALDVAAIAKGV